ncbi:hypothetical protein [Sphingomonas oryzagri]
MKMLVLAAVTIAAAVSPAVAAPPTSPQGHYEWSVPHQFGPRAPLEASRRIWVPAKTQMASCDCAMMKTDARACMASMPGVGPSPSTTTAG